MSDRDGFEAGVPCWVESLQPDPEKALAFYGGLFGWEFEGSGPIEDGPAGEYFVGRMRGRDVAGIAPTPRDFRFPKAVWVTQVHVDDAEASGAKAEAAGGSVIAGPFDFDPIGTLVVINDPTGATLALWEPGARAGAMSVNEANAWAMSSLQTPEPQTAASFYGELFGWTTEIFGEGPGAATMFRLPGFVGGEPGQPVSREVVAVMTQGEGDAAWVPGFWVESAQDSATYVAESGGQIVAGPLDGPTGQTFVVTDPQGALLTLSDTPTPH